MRLVHAAALTAAAMLLASTGFAQGIGGVAAREREKRKAAQTSPAKVYNDNDIGASVPAEPEPAADAEASGEGAAGERAGEGATAASEAQASGEQTAEQTADEERAKAAAQWRRKLDRAREEEKIYKQLVDQVQLELNDLTATLYGPGRANKLAFLEENLKKLADTQAQIAALEEEGRRNRY